MPRSLADAKSSGRRLLALAFDRRRAGIAALLLARRLRRRAVGLRRPVGGLRVAGVAAGARRGGRRRAFGRRCAGVLPFSGVALPCAGAGAPCAGAAFPPLAPAAPAVSCASGSGLSLFELR